MNSTEISLYHQLCCYTLSLADEAFLHQHVVDAFAAQTAVPGQKPIKLTFALVGLYLHVEQQFSGRQVQQVHMRLGQRKQDWPIFRIPSDAGDTRVADVVDSRPGIDRDRMIHNWCVSVWESYSGNRQPVIDLLSNPRIIHFG